MKKMVEERGLTLQPEKAQIVDAMKEGFDFLGYHFERNKRWLNAYFAELGLFTVTTAHALACQSRRGNH